MAAEGLELEMYVTPAGGAGVARDYVEGRGSAVSFFEGSYRDPDAYLTKAQEVDRRFDRAAREQAAQAMTVPAGGDASRLARFVEEGGYVVTTGQQPGLLGGPLYSVYKALTAVRLAAALEERTGRPVLPLFWVASEDHDWEEADHTWLLGPRGKLHRLSVADPHPSRRPPLHAVPLGSDADKVAATFAGLLPDSDFTRPWRELVAATCRPGVTLPEGFHGLMHAVLGRFGVVFTDAADPVVKGASASVLRHELERSTELEEVLAATAARLERAGYGLQVTLMDEGANVFLDVGGRRERLYRIADGGFATRDRAHAFERSELLDGLAADPAPFSPNVLLRPVVESAVFPTLSYVAGPGETAYYAQLKDYFLAHGARMPVIHPRASVTVVEHKVRKVLDKFGLDPGDVAAPLHDLLTRVARDRVPEPVRRLLDEIRSSMDRNVQELDRAVQDIDPTLSGPSRGLGRSTFHAVDRVEKKIVGAVKREYRIAFEQLEKARRHLVPDEAPQERRLNPLYFLTRYGDDFLDQVHGLIDVGPSR